MFHLSLPCKNLENTRSFYLAIPGAKQGRHQNHWADIDLFGNQLTFIEIDSDFKYPSYRFEETAIPTFHFGIILDSKEWNGIKDELNKTTFVEPVTFLEGKKGEHQSFFIEDPNGYTIEFKSFMKAGEAFED